MVVQGGVSPCGLRISSCIRGGGPLGQRRKGRSTCPSDQGPVRGAGNCAPSHDAPAPKSPSLRGPWGSAPDPAPQTPEGLNFPARGAEVPGPARKTGIARLARKTEERDALTPPRPRLRAPSGARGTARPATTQPHPNPPAPAAPGAPPQTPLLKRRRG
ncbi:hypothetical protein CP970_16170 [Streptomyces kanamyceticus]|uniref:Uncharacterized protein n=1 Tax=Streptomyces kanamyceticus TaxID=1967 RepID=A0A5J6GE27_STRKN|nr:hypothetical protein CP970_16170 [Streptomyces kanamyceticus]